MYNKFLAIFGIVIVVWLIVGTREKNPEITYVFNSIWEEVALLKGLFTNRYIRTLCVILLIKRVGLGVMETVGPVYLVMNGFPKETLSKISLIAFPFVVTIPFFVGKYAMGGKKENKVLMISLCFAILNMTVFWISSYVYVDGLKKTGAAIISINLFATEFTK